MLDSRGVRRTAEVLYERCLVDGSGLEEVETGVREDGRGVGKIGKVWGRWER